MPPKSKSIFRQPGAQHFQLVHRSQRDPLINDPEASTHVLKPFERDNLKKGKSRAELEEILGPDELPSASKRIGEASLYGVYYDDTEYDYMQHLRAAGGKEEGVESILIEGPAPKNRPKKSVGFDLAELPDGVLASKTELPRTYESQQAIPESISGFQPDMDAHLRQVLEALEDDAFVEDDLEDDFFQELVQGGERKSDESFPYEFHEYGDEDAPPGPEDDEDEGSWQKQFAAFKRQQKAAGSDDELGSEGGDTVGTLPAISVIGGKKRRKGGSDATGYTMSSGSMYRNDALQTLDARFDQMILKHYGEDDDEMPEDESGDDDDDEAPELITSREDFDNMINTFLNDFEIVGRKMKPKLEGETGFDKLDIIRRAMGQDERVRMSTGDDSDVDTDELFPSDDEDKKDQWDCETVLTTHTNLENHPRLIRARASKPTPKIVLDKKTGLPSLAEAPGVKSKTRAPVAVASDESDSEEDTRAPRQTIARKRNESKEEKQARKSAAKAEKQARRDEKRTRKEQFDAEIKSQKTALSKQEPRTRHL